MMTNIRRERFLRIAAENDTGTLTILVQEFLDQFSGTISTVDLVDALWPSKEAITDDHIAARLKLYRVLNAAVETGNLDGYFILVDARIRGRAVRRKVWHCYDVGAEELIQIERRNKPLTEVQQLKKRIEELEAEIERSDIIANNAAAEYKARIKELEQTILDKVNAPL